MNKILAFLMMVVILVFIAIGGGYLVRDNIEKDNELKSLEQENNTLKQSLNNALDESNSLKAQIDETTKNLEDERNANIQAQVKIADLEKRLEDANLQLEYALKVKEGAMTEVNRLKEELNQAKLANNGAHPENGLSIPGGAGVIETSVFGSDLNQAQDALIHLLSGNPNSSHLADPFQLMILLAIPALLAAALLIGGIKYLPHAKVVAHVKRTR